ncbi:MAG: hypothetical protein ACI4RD_09035 [Kiritimatiellia bacterium]
MRDPRHDEFERLRQRAVELGNTDSGVAYREVLALLSSEFPIVRKAAASALDKLIGRRSDIAAICKSPLLLAIEGESGEQTLQFMLRAAAKCAQHFNRLDFDILRDIARNPSHKDYVRTAASEAIARGEREARGRTALRRHWCTRCRKPITAAESQRGIDQYGKPYCRHCLEERMHEDANFEANVETAKQLRTVDEVAVQSQGEKRIGDWLAQNAIAYEYDERIIVAGDTRIRPDFYLPEFDLYIEYWGMNTSEYIENMRKKKFLYQREGKKLISLSYRDLPDLEHLLRLKLSRYIRL